MVISREGLKFLQIVLAVLIVIGMILIFSQSLWVPKVVQFQLKQEGLTKYYNEL